MTPPDQNSTGTRPKTADRIGVVSAFLLDRESLLPVVASRLGSDETFESTIRGGSMAPAVPKFSRLCVRLLGDRVPESGDVLYYLADDGFVIHRLVHHVSPSNCERYYVTIGDNCLVPDPPVSEDRVLGVVIAVETTCGRRPPGAPHSNSIFHRIARGISISATLVASHISISAATRVAALFRWVEDIGRVRVGRALRYLGLSDGR
jgi:hypothetical protein